MSDNPESVRVSSDNQATSGGRRLPSLFGGLVLGGALAAMGGLFVYALLGLGFAKVLDADAWQQTPCTILKSGVKTERPTPHSPGLSHELEIEYEYEFGGSTYQSTRFRRMATRSAHLDKMEAIAESYPARSQAVCFVDPKNPSDAVLKKDTRSVAYTVWFPGLFVLGGVGIMLASVRRFLRSR
ncbi:MAG: DUF3592 domain-containing protein [Verrucomicrobiales bacterium]